MALVYDVRQVLACRGERVKLTYYARARDITRIDEAEQGSRRSPGVDRLKPVYGRRSSLALLARTCSHGSSSAFRAVDWLAVRSLQSRRLTCGSVRRKGMPLGHCFGFDGSNLIAHPLDLRIQVPWQDARRIGIVRRNCRDSNPPVRTSQKSIESVMVFSRISEAVHNSTDKGP
jgi:hypothetical protein